MPRPLGLIGLTLSLVAIVGLTGALFVAPFAAAALGDAIFDKGAGVRAAVGVIRAALAGEGSGWLLPAFLAGCWFYAAMAGAVLTLARLRGGAHWRDLVAWRAWSPLRAGSSWWILLVCGAIWGFAASLIIQRISPAVDDLSGFPRSGLALASAFAMIAIAAPIAEELLFRGWIFTSLRARWSFWPANLASAALFAAAHWEHTHLYALGVFPIGVMLGAARESADR